ncbi:MAG: glycosyltransferase, partial [Candidatus Zixiibacteriota bacterium]
MMKSNDISVCLINKDSGNEIARCLDSVKSFADEIIVVDTGSEDNSPDLARQYGAKLVSHRWSNDFSAARNVYLKAAQCSWILVMDSDEVLDIDAATILKWALAEQPKTAFFLNIHNYFHSDKMSCWSGPDDMTEEIMPGVSVSLSTSIRLFPKYSRIQYSYAV